MLLCVCTFVRVRAYFAGGIVCRLIFAAINGASNSIRSCSDFNFSILVRDTMAVLCAVCTQNECTRIQYEITYAV